ncbi:phosphatidylinositol 3,4,5-trisphosphate 3-phosphatase TPTE2-like isoform X2 [Mustela putorius furo]|uniref:Phosphatidylinositol 3,4,5-trisphosphate 3-phosphatase TPTE2-like isoform X2 n=1 Tax=Mustela putorius furo TaxID=9669 RepID=A0A8U0S4U7_MUSPF|nr:phosphatidylinositol 3,4,5-trisphosphate 3-phosphatase TPTE2-like isoform X2 [Mustela putorius furo]
MKRLKNNHLHISLKNPKNKVVDSFLASSDGSDAKSPAQSEWTLETYEESTSEIPVQSERTSENYEDFTTGIPGQSEWTASSTEELCEVITSVTELKLDMDEQITSKFPGQSEWTAPSTEGLCEVITSVTELKLDMDEEITSKFPGQSEWTAPSTEGLCEVITSVTELKLDMDEEITSKFPGQSEWTAPSTEGLCEVITSVTELKLDMDEEITSKFPGQSEWTAPSTEGLSEVITSVTELKLDTDEEITSKFPGQSEWTAPSTEGLSEVITTTMSEFTSGTSDGISKEIIMERLSRFHDEDTEDSVFLNSNDSIISRILYSLVSSLTFRIFGIMLVFVDLSLIITDLIVANSTTYIPLEYHSISLAIALFFLMDVLLRAYVEGIKYYFSDALNFLDAVIIVMTLLIDIIYMFFDFKSLQTTPRLTIFFRPLRLVILVRVFHLAHQKRHLEQLARRMVSGNKRRYRKDGFDLDLTYITERIIGMSFPSSGKESFYRNPIEEVVRFLDTKHREHYQIYNLCSERAYNPKYFHDRVQRIKIDDHNVPSLSEMVAFAKEVNEWMSQDDKNIVVIHCKGGKGRTGTMICAYLIASGIFTTAEESLFYFGERRTDKSTSSKFQGVETPSQSRYVGYFADVKNIYNMTLPPRKTVKIEKIVIHSIHGVGKGNGTDLKVQIVMQRQIIFFGSASKNCQILHDAETDSVTIHLSNCPPLYDDIKVQFFSSSDLPKYYDQCPFFFWFHTSFLQNKRYGSDIIQ